jgi:hypothetical protein
MSWLFPHTVTAYAVTSTVDGTTKLEGNPVVSDSGTTVNVDFQPNANPGRVFTDWGIDIENPAILFGPPTSLSTFAVNTRVVYDGNTYVVKGVKKWETGQSDMDYVKALLTNLNE